MSVACGSTCTFYIDEYGDLFRCGVLNKKVEAAYSIPFKIPMTEPVVYVDVRKDHAAIITRDRKLYVFGDGEDGKLGTGFANKEINPKQIFVHSGNTWDEEHHIIKTVICENRSTIYLCENGIVFASGHHTMRENDDALTRARARGWDAEQKILKYYSMKRLFFGIEMIAAAEYEALALSKDGNVFCWGYIRQKWTRHEHFNNELVTYIAGGNKRYVAITEHGNVYMWKSTTSPKLVESENLFHGSKPRVAACAGIVTYVVTEDGSLWLSGSLEENRWRTSFNFDFRKVIFEENTKIMSVSTSSGHTAALATDGELWTWGNNSHKQLGREKIAAEEDEDEEDEDEDEDEEDSPPIPKKINRNCYAITQTKHARVGYLHDTQPKTEAMLHRGIPVTSDNINTIIRWLYFPKLMYWERWHAPQQKLELLVTRAKMSLRFGVDFLQTKLSFITN